MKRRRLLAAVAAGSVGWAAGCTGDGGRSCSGPEITAVSGSHNLDCEVDDRTEVDVTVAAPDCEHDVTIVAGEGWGRESSTQTVEAGGSLQARLYYLGAPRSLQVRLRTDSDGVVDERTVLIPETPSDPMAISFSSETLLTETVTAGEPVRVSIGARNDGSSGNYRAELLVDGDTKDTTTGSIAGEDECGPGETSIAMSGRIFEPGEHPIAAVVEYFEERGSADERRIEFGTVTVEPEEDAAEG